MDKKILKDLLADLLKSEQLTEFAEQNAELLANLQERWTDFLTDKAVENSQASGHENTATVANAALSGEEITASQAAENQSSSEANNAAEAAENSQANGHENAATVANADLSGDNSNDSTAATADTPLSILDYSLHKAPLIGDTAHQNQPSNSTMPIPPYTPQPSAAHQPAPKAPILPNAQQGKAYQATLNAEFVDVQFLPECGLAWDKERREISGTPNISGEVKVRFALLGQITPLHGSLYINADPNSLWQNIPSDKAARFYKADTHHESLATEAATLLAARVRGRSHAHVGSFCDDDFALAYFAEQNVYLLTVSDGAGSAAFSREGSRLAVQAVKEAVSKLLADKAQNYHRLAEMDDSNRQKTAEAMIKIAAYQAFAAHHQAMDESTGVSLKSLSCTLLIALLVPLNDGQWLTQSYWVGDGAAAIYCPNSQQLQLLGEGDAGQYSGETLFLSAKEVGENLQSRIRGHISEALPLLMLMTDGVSDPKFETEAQLKNADKWQALWQELQMPLAAENAAAALEDWLGFHSKGNYDDRTLALLLPNPLQAQTTLTEQEQNHG